MPPFRPRFSPIAGSFDLVKISRMKIWPVLRPPPFLRRSCKVKRSVKVASVATVTANASAFYCFNVRYVRSRSRSTMYAHDEFKLEESFRSTRRSDSQKPYDEGTGCPFASLSSVLAVLPFVSDDRREREEATTVLGPARPFQDQLGLRAAAKCKT